MSTIVDGTANLSSVVRSQQFFDDLILKNNELKNYDEWIAGGRVGPEPRIPFLYNNTSDAKDTLVVRLMTLQKLHQLKVMLQER